MTYPYESLEETLRQLANNIAGERSLAKSTCCLALLATTGQKPEWNVREFSKGHRVIPLVDKQTAEQHHMIAQLVYQSGNTAEMLKYLALNARIAVLPFVSKKIYINEKTVLDETERLRSIIATQTSLLSVYKKNRCSSVQTAGGLFVEIYVVSGEIYAKGMALPFFVNRIILLFVCVLYYAYRIYVACCCTSA